MTNQTPTPTITPPHAPLPRLAVGHGITVTPGTISLGDGSHLEIATNIPEDAAARRLAVQNATLYCPTGRLRGTPYLSAYVGLSAALHTDRAATSYTNWVIAQRKITDLTGMALLRRDRPYPHDQLKYVEARVMQNLSNSHGTIALTNRQTSAQIAANRLPRHLVLEGQELADEIAWHIWHRLFNQRTNPWPAPAANTREQAVRIVHRAATEQHRAVDVHDIVTALRAIGHATTARHFDFSVRRDLEQREPSRGRPRIYSTEHHHRRLFWAPTITRRDALDGYNQAKHRR